MPNESESANTVKLEVQLPTDTPFLDVSTKPLPGWTVKTTEAPLPEPVEMEGTKITKAVSTVVWTASPAAGVKPGEYQDFSISVGPLPKPGAIEIPAVQTYSDGKVVRWNEPTPASGDEPEYPVPTFVITAAEPDSADGGAAAPAPDASETAVNPTDATDPLARALGIGGLLVGVAGVADRRGCGAPLERDTLGVVTLMSRFAQMARMGWRLLTATLVAAVLATVGARNRCESRLGAQRAEVDQPGGQGDRGPYAVECGSYVRRARHCDRYEAGGHRPVGSSSGRRATAGR